MSFKAVQGKIAKKEGIPPKNAGAILAAASRKASPAAKKKNPKLNKVAGGKTQPKVPPTANGPIQRAMRPGSSPASPSMPC